MALGLGFSFGLYGLTKKKVGVAAPPLPGLAVETMGVAVSALAYLGWLAAKGLNTVDPISGYGALVALAGPVTAIPLLLFAAAAGRIPLSTMGILQYIAPIGQFLVGWLVFHEPMPAARWAGFALVWAAVVLFVADGVLTTRRRR